MTFLFFTLPSNDLGLLARSLPIARALRDRGHTVEFCTPARAAGARGGGSPEPCRPSGAPLPDATSSEPKDIL